jgi:cysteine-rich repeat protein
VIDEEGGESCDDGNDNNGDGCSAKCIEETCGDGIVQNYT